MFIYGRCRDCGASTPFKVLAGDVTLVRLCLPCRDRAGKAAPCATCKGEASVTTPGGNERGCPACPAGDRFEEALMREAIKERERDEDGTGQDQESFEGIP